jgi:hypothetical protein
VAGLVGAAAEGTQWWEVAIPAAAALGGVLVGGWIAAWTTSRSELRDARTEIYLKHLPKLRDLIPQEQDDVDRRDVARNVSKAEKPPHSIWDAYELLYRTAVTTSKGDVKRARKFRPVWSRLETATSDRAKAYETNKYDEQLRVAEDAQYVGALNDLWTEALSVVDNYNAWLESKLVGRYGEGSSRRRPWWLFWRRETTTPAARSV